MQPPKTMTVQRDVGQHMCMTDNTRQTLKWTI